MERSDSIYGAKRLYLMERQRLKEGGSGGADAPPVLGGSGGRRPPVSGGVRGGVTPPRVPYFSIFFHIFGHIFPIFFPF